MEKTITIVICFVDTNQYDYSYGFIEKRFNAIPVRNVRLTLIVVHKPNGTLTKIDFCTFF